MREEPVDFRLVVAEFLEDLRGVFTASRRWHVGNAAMSVDAERKQPHLQRPAAPPRGRRESVDRPACRHLRMVEDFRQRADPGHRDAAIAEDGLPLGGGAGCQNRGDGVLESLLVGGTRRAVAKTRVLDPLGPAEAAPSVIRLMEKDPQMQISVDVQPHRLLQHWVAGHQFDLGLGFLPAVHAAIRAEAIGRVPMVAVLHPGHPLAGRETLTVTDLAPYPLIAMAPGSLIRHQTDTVFAAARIPMKPRIEVSAMVLACNIVAEGHGYAIFDPLVPTTVGQENLVSVPLVPRVGMEFGFLYPRDDLPSPVVEDFVAIVRQVAGEFIHRHGYDRWPPANQ